MALGTKLAGIKFIQQDITVYGRTIIMSDEFVTVTLQTMPQNKAVLQKGTRSELILMSRGALLMADTEVFSSEDRDVCLRFTGKPYSIFRRQSPRYSCHIPMSFRPEGRIEWNDAIIRDISMGGMGAELIKSGEVSGILELKFGLPTDEAPGRLTKQKKTPGLRLIDTQTQAPTDAILTKGQVTFQKKLIGAKTIVGLEFLETEPALTEQLTHLIDGLKRAEVA